ncbi:hypothetical protein D3C75_389700 [compost metagenome]
MLSQLLVAQRLDLAAPYDPARIRQGSEGHDISLSGGVPHFYEDAFIHRLSRCAV